jgi:Big-like domain-containing protein/IPT/TIG domain-containing protein/beta-propeller repeat-containing protein
MSEHTLHHSSRIGILRFLGAVAVMGAMVSAPARDANAATPASEGTQAGAATASKARLAESYGRLPLSFEAYQGQAAKNVQFVARGQGYGLYLTGEAAVLTLRRPGGGFTARELPRGRTFGHSREILRAISRIKGTPASRFGERPATPAEANPNDAAANDATPTDMVQMRLAGALAGVKPVGVEMLPGTANYILGKDASKWRTGVPTYARVRYAGVYPGVDLVYYGDQRQLEYDFVVAPGASPKPIQLRFDGAKSVKLDGAGNLVIAAANGKMAFQKPVVYQMEGGQRRPVEGSFRLLTHNRAGFALGPFDRSKPLIIDPVLSYSTYLGGTDWDYSAAIAVDAAGNAYVTGFTVSLDFPVTAGGDQLTNSASSANSESTAFITKLNASGTALVYSTYLGGSGSAGNSVQNGGNGEGDNGNSIAVDAEGNAYVTGWTYSSDFPLTAGAYQSTNFASANLAATGFVSELNANGTSLLYSTYLGGSILDYPTTLTLDSQNNVYVAGFTFSGNFPTTKDAYQTNNNSFANGNGGWNTFVSKLKTTESGSASLVYSTYLGGTEETDSNIAFSGQGYYAAVGLAVDTLGDAYVATFANSNDFPLTSGAYQKSNLAYSAGGTNITVSKLNPTGTGLVYSTYLGGSATVAGNLTPGDYSTGLVIDSSGDAYVTGFTFSSDFPTTKGAFQTTNFSAENSDYTAFVSKLNPGGTALVYSTYLGGSGGDVAYALAIDGSDDVYLTGATGSSDFPVTKGAYQTTNVAAEEGGDTAFLTELNPAGNGELYSTFLGGSVADSGYGVALGSGGAVYLTGFTASPDYPVTPDTFETTYNSAVSTAFVSEFDLGTAPTTLPTNTTLTASANPQLPGAAVTFTATVAPVSGTSVPAGNVAFSVDEVTVATVALGSNGQATYLASDLTQGKHYILASYEGNTTYASSGAGLTESIQYPLPTISGLSPFVADVGGAGFTLTINGTNFYPEAAVTWGSTALTTTYVSATQLTALVPASLIASTGSAELTVTSLGGTSAPATFTITSNSTFPLLLSLSPASATAGGAQFTLTVTGANFAANSVVLWNGLERATTNSGSSTQLKATILATDIPAEGTALVTVATPNVGTSAGQPFAVQSSNPVATITGASLTDTSDENGNFTLTLTGTDFVPASTVQWSGVSLTTTYLSPYQIWALVPTPDYLLLPVVVTVKNSSSSTSAGFEVAAAQPD